MMKVIQIRERLGAFVAILLISCAPAMAGERGTPEQAQAMVADAIAYYDVNGEAATIAAINADDPVFHQNDLYVFLLARDGTMLAHPIDPGLVGLDATTMKDVDGKAFGQEFVDKADANGGWVDYKWKDPSTGDVAAKSSWVVLHKGNIFGAGIYLP